MVFELHQWQTGVVAETERRCILDPRGGVGGGELRSDAPFAVFKLGLWQTSLYKGRGGKC